MTRPREHSRRRAPPMSTALGPLSGSTWTSDLVLAAALFGFGVLPYLFAEAPVLALAAVLPLPAVALRRRQPELALGLAVTAALGQLVLAGEAVLTVVVVPLMVYTAARWTAELAQVALTAGLFGAVAGPLRWTFVGLYGGDLLTFVVAVGACAGIVCAAYLLGRRRRESARSEQRESEAAAERLRLTRAEEEQRSRVQTAWERARIARELHDVVAHSLSVIVVQAEGGRALATRAPDQAAAALGTIAETGRGALEEMRRIVGLLRGDQDGEQADYRPTPGFADLPDLVRRTTPGATLRVFGDPPAEAGPTVGLTAYRTVQEALTNVLKHAGPAATAQVNVAYTATSVELEVVDDGRGAAAEPDGSGLGLRGMRERVELIGGSLSASPRPGGGFLVRASLPLASGAPA